MAEKTKTQNEKEREKMMGEKVKIQEIKAVYQALNPDDEPMLQQFIHTYAVDERSGVQDKEEVVSA